ncbi:beta-phosphoglucomutase [Nostoc parmelioides]|uniref:Beta-phosphoglucomutase n=1 Tax=Nostoc parmelioides FACHB-3921 TaxID=2692909 RepID=A0ABR8BEC7_9NOSO|nr:beta-phosphoglucomutase [Nostoc parmelioides]MBD2252447.1 beta-phosphoglucomutase [Nostoc parmelioides FACHB-3921]
MNTKCPARDFIYQDWILTETRFNPEQLHSRGTVFTIGNGYLGTRGSLEEGHARGLPATFIHGVYDDVPVVYTELANCPDWLPMIITINGDRFRMDQGEVLQYERKLDVSQGLLSRSLRWRSPSGSIIDIHFERFASLADQHILGQRCQITAHDGDCLVEIQASINGYAENQGFNHWEGIDQGKTESGIWLESRTRGTQIEIGMAAKMTISGAEAALQVSIVPGYPTISASFLAKSQQTITVEKLVTVFTSREVNKQVTAAQEKLAQLPDYTTLLTANQQAWDEVWQKSDIYIEGDPKAAFAVRYNLFQLLIAAPSHDEKVSIPAKTLSGFGYRGHIFWDTEIFILPFFIFTQPALARNLLSYRYHTINGARRKATHYGFKGAMYAWESADTGDEVTPRWALPDDYYGEDVRIWCRDREIHNSADIAYAVWQYWQATGDDVWMGDYGAEIILDAAIFWSSRVEYNSQGDRYEIRGVIGTDEYHEFVHNNTFTNRMVQWHLEKALKVADWLRHTFPEGAKELEEKLQITPELEAHWQDIIKKICIFYDSSTGLIEQFEGFFQLKDINLEDYEPRQRSMQAILGIETANQHQVLKQPDVLMLLYLMRPSAEFPYNEKALKSNWDYYAPRTDITYGSSLGPAIHGILASDLGKSATAYERFMQALMVDLEDSRGNANDGIHGASAGGIWQAVIFGFGGIQFTEQGPTANPHLPPNWTRLKFQLHWRGQWYQFDLPGGQEAGGREQEEKSQGGFPSGRTSGAGEQSSTLKAFPLALPLVEKGGAEEEVFTLQSPLPNTQSPDIRGFIFDLDGVLTDTAEYHYLGWQRLADEEGIPFDREANEALRGVSRRESLMRIIGDRPYSEAQIQEMMERKNRYYIELIEHITPKDLLPGAIALLDELRQAGIKIGIGSASKNAHTVIERLGLADKVDAIADGYSVQTPKPAPDLFIFATHQLGLEPKQCVVVEDAAAGVEAALAGGMWTIGLGPIERVGAAHVVLPSLAGVTWTDLRTKLNEAARV